MTKQNPTGDAQAYVAPAIASRQPVEGLLTVADSIVSDKPQPCLC